MLEKGESPVSSAEQLKYEFRTILLKVAGASEEEIQSLDLNSMSDDEFLQLLREILSRR